MGQRRGKLKAVARWLVVPADAATGPDDEEGDAALRALGVSDEQIDAGRAVRSGGDGGQAEAPPLPWPWHRDAARLFGAMRRQWRVVSGAAGLLYLGLDFNALGEVRRMLRIKPTPELMDQLRTMEAAGAEALNELQG